MVVPIGVLTLTLRFESVAPLEITKLAVMVVEPVTTRFVAWMPPPETDIPVAPVRFVPVRVTGTVVPCVPAVGLIDVRVGPVTAKDTVFELPMGVVTLTLRDETEALDASVKVAVTLVLLVAETLLTVTPLPDTTTAVAEDRFVPVSVTGKLVPRSPDVGLMDVSVIAMMVKDWAAPVPAL